MISWYECGCSMYRVRTVSSYHIEISSTPDNISIWSLLNYFSYWMSAVILEWKTMDRGASIRLGGRSWLAVGGGAGLVHISARRDGLSVGRPDPRALSLSPGRIRTRPGKMANSLAQIMRASSQRERWMWETDQPAIPLNIWHWNNSDIEIMGGLILDGAPWLI